MISRESLEHERRHVQALTRLSFLVLALAFFWNCELERDPNGPQTPSCLEHAVFGEPSESPYVLPFPIGTEYEVFQTYCGPVSHGKDGQLAIDFLMPIGADVAAARSGTVRRVVDQHPDYGRQFNSIYIEHEDHTSAFYGHLQEGSALVQVGDVVVAGQIIAKSGSSGTSLPHLHFGVARHWPPRNPDDLPVNFRNSEGKLDGRNGLLKGVRYRALPY